MSEPVQHKTLVEALAAAQAEFTPVMKTKTAKVTGKGRNGEYSYEYEYADFADVLKMALPILSRHGIAFSQPLLRKESGKLCLTSRVMFGEEVLSSDGIWIPETSSPQEFGSCLTYWRRYDGCSLLGIQPDADEDAKLATMASKTARGTDKLDKKIAKEQLGQQFIKPFQVEAFIQASSGKTKAQLDEFLRNLGIASPQEITKQDFDMCIKWAVNAVDPAKEPEGVSLDFPKVKK
jgi:ERF superfamily